MNVIEAVARAIDPKAFAATDTMIFRIGPARHDGTYETQTVTPTERQAEAMDKARAALTALRDNGVTEGMAEAYWASEDAGEFAWHAMLDAALKEE